jgi:hypothetical protein
LFAVLVPIEHHLAQPLPSWRLRSSASLAMRLRVLSIQRAIIS